jgi:hypothetical protein
MLNCKATNIKYSFKKINLYYYNLLATNTLVEKKIYQISYPIFYKEVYYFELIGKTLKITTRDLNLNSVIKYKSIIDKSKFIINIPIQIPYLIY